MFRVRVHVLSSSGNCCLLCPVACLRLLLLVSQFVSEATGQSVATLRPLFKATPQNVTFGVGDRAILKCRVDNLGTRTITWRRQGETHPLTIGEFTFAPDPRLSVENNQRLNEWSLIIDEVRPEDEGIYFCQVTVKNDPHENAYLVRLNVKTVHLTGTEYVELGSPIRLLCNASGPHERSTHIEWYFENQPIDSDVTSGLFITTKFESQFVFSMVLISKSSSRHRGAYSCRTSRGDMDSMSVHVLDGISAERIIGDEDDDGERRRRIGQQPIAASSSGSSSLPLPLPSSIWLPSGSLLSSLLFAFLLDSNIH